jgi:hypothetical protein
MNATLQVLKSIPEMQENLETYIFSCNEGNDRYTPTASQTINAFTAQNTGAVDRSELARGLRDLFRSMSETVDSYNPILFLQVSPSLVFPYSST